MWRPSLLFVLLLATGLATAAARPGPGGDPASANRTPRSRPLGRAGLPLKIDMGVSTRPTHGAITCGADTRNPGFGWAYGMVRSGDVLSEPDSWYGDFVEGEDATFTIAVEPAESTFTIELTLGDPARTRGPVDVLLNDRRIAPAVMTRPGERQEIRAATGTRNGLIEIRLASAGCAGFALSGLKVSGPEGAWLGELSPARPGTELIPPAETLPRLGEEETRRLLRQLCEHLVTFGPRQGGYSYHGAWYQNAYPVRTLLAASRILDERRYAEAAFLCLDHFASKQLPGGNWLSTYYGSAACDTAVLPDTSSANLADIGTMTLCLAVAAPQAGEPRSLAYTRAARVYADRISLPGQLKTGAFPNGRWAGRELTLPYSVATATQAASLAALYNISGESRYLKAAERAARWLSASFRQDGSFLLYPHDKPEPVLKESTDFGDIFYVAEALIWVRTFTRDNELRAAIDKALNRWLQGSRGLLSKTQNGYWFLPQDSWGSSKMAGLLFVLAGQAGRGDDPIVSTWLERAIAWMSDVPRARSLGVMEHPAGPRGAYALAATGFAGLGVAAALDMNALFPRRPE